MSYKKVGLRKALDHARVAQRFVRWDGRKSITSETISSEVNKVQRRRDQERALKARRELLEILGRDFTPEEVAKLATKCPTGKAYGWSDLHRKKARTLPMMSWV